MQRDTQTALYSSRRPDLERHILQTLKVRVRIWQEEGGDEFIAQGSTKALDDLQDWLLEQDHWELVEIEPKRVIFFIPRVALCVRMAA